jgi:2-dehydropantoate 2-reductase
LRIAIVGAGAMGSIYGAALFEGGCDVLLVDVSPTHVDAIRANGLVIRREGDERTLDLPATTEPASEQVVDAAFVFVKGYDTESALDFAEPLIGPHTVLVSLQNGWGNGDVLARAAAEKRVVIGISYHSAAVLGPGHILHTNAGVTRVGPLAGHDLTHADAVADALHAGGFDCEVTTKIRQEVWKKLTLNTAALPPAALTALRAAELPEPPVRELVLGLASETLAVGRAMGFEVDEAAELEHVCELLVSAGSGKASMLQDVELGRQTEIDTINAAVVRLGEEYGVAVPLNRAMVALIRGYEQAHGLVRVPVTDGTATE